MNGRQMTAVINKDSGRAESYWNTPYEADAHIRRYRMEKDFKTRPATVPREQDEYAGAERRRN